MIGKICLVTGATSGIGQVTALELARMGATVVIVARSRERSEATKAKIVAQTGNPSVEIILADLAELAAVRRAAEEFRARYDRLDVLVNNAGLYLDKRTLSADGLELTFAVNHLAPFLLTHELLEPLRAVKAARIVTVSSGAHMGGRGRFDDLRAEKGYMGFAAYAESKLANILFTYELARRIDGSGMTANCLHPGAVQTGFASGTGGIFGGIFGLARPFMLTPEQGAETSIYLASSPEVEGVNGKYFAKRRPQTTSMVSYDRALQAKLWALSEQVAHVAPTETWAAASPGKP